MKLLWLICVVTVPWTGNASPSSGVHFVPAGTVYASYSGWIISFSLDLEPYQAHVTRLRRNLEDFQGTVDMLLSRDTSHLVEGTKMAIRYLRREWSHALMQELTKLNMEQVQLDDLFNNLRLTSVQSRRSKRAVIPIVGDLLSALFGVSSDRDLKQVRRGLNLLRGSQAELAHVVSQALTLVNKTNAEVTRNRNSINQLATRVNQLTDDVKVLFEDLHKKVHPMLIFQQLTTRLLNNMRLVSNSIRDTFLGIRSIQRDIHEVLQGQLPSTLVQPRNLKNVLLQIQKELPTGLSLPADPRGQVNWYYNNLATALLPDSNKFHVLTMVPLIEGDALYSLYRIVSVPTPHISRYASAEYDVEYPYMAISGGGAKYLPLAVIDAEKCVRAEIGYCSFTNPISSLAHRPSCVSALFTKDQNLIRRFCRVKLSPVDEYPTAKYLLGAKWLISTTNDLTIHVTCAASSGPSKLKTVVVTERVSILDLGEGCTGYNDYISLPAYTMGRTSESIEQSFTQQVLQFEALPGIWNLTRNVSMFWPPEYDTLSKITPLPSIPPIQIRELQGIIDAQINKLSKPTPAQYPGLQYTSYAIGLLTLCGLIIAAFCIGKKKLFNIRRKRYDLVRYKKSQREDDVDIVCGETCVTPNPNAPLKPEPDTMEALGARPSPFKKPLFA